MHFTRLRVLGFKSFVEPTEFVIEPGLTGVVGPNGCGKSNLVEALRWVMGESSYKNMRASAMDDVIFQGSHNRPARNSAEVSLVVDNAERRAPTPFNDAETIEITRRIEREAGSVYRINAREVRARDVQLLFADASTGAHSPAIVGQGRIGELIAAKPTDRRGLLEEAAGIAGLHNRRHEAELRLRAAEQNLARLDDVIVEITQQFDALKRQARQATRYRNLSGEIRKAEAAALHLRWVAASSALTESETTLAAAKTAAEARAAEQAQAGRIQAEAAAAVPGLRDEAARAGAALQRITLAREALDADEARVTGRLSELERQLAQLADDIGREQRMIADHRAILARLDEEERDLESANAALADRQSTAAARRRAADTTLGESETSLATLTARHAEMTARRTQWERTIAETAQRMARIEAEMATISGDLAALDSDGAAAALAERRAAVEHAEADLATAESGSASAEQRHAATRDGVAAARDALAKTERTLGRVETESATLAALLASTGGGDATPVIDLVTVEPGYEAALGAAFGDDLDVPADETAPAHWRTIAAAGDPALPTGATPLARHVAAPEVLARRLAQTGIVDAEDGPALQKQLRPGQRLVSQDGDLWRWDGFVAGADAPGAAAQRLASRNRLAELTGEISIIRADATVKREAFDAAERAAEQAASAEGAAREAQKNARRRLDECRARLADAERDAGRLAARRSGLDEAYARLTAGLEEARALHDEASAGLALGEDPAALGEALAETRATVETERAAAAEARAAVDGLAREAEIRSGRLAAIAVERQSWRERAANAEGQVATLGERREAAETEKQRLADEPARIEEKRRALLSEVATAETNRATANDALVASEAALAEADKAARIALDALAEARERRGRAEERMAAGKERLAELAQRIEEALDCAPEALIEIAEIKPDASPALDDVEARLDRYRQERERLGAVNLRAEAEAAELGERRDALAAERDDLIAAIGRLRQGIASLNREGRERLTAAFATVNDHFKRLFTHLFGGGTAELQLTESDDPLQAGLEIVARPPGKKPQTMTLLSGGEQALTAMSLIFAVFLTNPAPICVLDEVDAPLDDANVERFCALLEQMTRETDTRFIVITHNPITMARMKRLYGVTMAERGVSQLVSVDLETAERFREAG